MSKPSESDIAKHAYQLWEREGRPQGRDKDHWHAAEREILGAAKTQEERPSGETRNAQHTDTRKVEPPPSLRQTGSASPGRPAQPASPAGTQAAAAPGKRAAQVQSEQAAGAKQQQSGAKNSASLPPRKPRGGAKQSDT